MQSRHTKRYAQSLIDMAADEGQVERAYEDADTVADAIDQSRDLHVVLQSPVIKTGKKLQILKAIFEGKISDTFMNFIDLVARKGREDELLEICHAVESLYRERFNILHAQAVTAVALDDRLRNKVKNLVAQLGDQVELTEQIDPDILGGIIVTVGDRQIDASIARQLADLKREFSKNPAQALQA